MPITSRQASVNAAIGIKGEVTRSYRLEDTGEILSSSGRKRQRNRSSSYVRTLSPRMLKAKQDRKEPWSPSKGNQTIKGRREVAKQGDSNEPGTKPEFVLIDESRTSYMSVIKKVVAYNEYVLHPEAGQKRGYQFPAAIGDLHFMMCFTPKESLSLDQTRELERHGFRPVPDADVEELNAIVADNLSDYIQDSDQSAKSEPEDEKPAKKSRIE